MTKEDKILKAFKSGLQKVSREDCSIYHDHERQWGLEFKLNEVSYRGIVTKYKNVEIENKGWKKWISKYKTIEILQPSISITIKNDINHFSAEIEDNDFITYYEEFFKDVQKAIELKYRIQELKRKEETEQFLNNILN
jgi:hypothetical protein